MAELDTLTIEEASERLIDYRGKTPPKTSSGVRLITAKVIKGGQILEEPKEFIAASFYDEWMRRGLPRKLDVLITTEAPLGEVAILRDDEKIALAQRVILLRAREGIVDPLFMFYALQSDFGQGELKARASGTTVLGIKQSELRQVRIPVFPLPTQHRIASILTAYDELIENNQRRIRILEDMVRSLYREWFVHFCYPGHESVPLVDSPLGQIPQGWAVKPLEAVCSLITDGAHHSPASVPDGFPMASVKDMHNWGINLGTCRKISEDDYALLVRNNCKPQKNDVLIAKDGSYLKHIFVMNKDEDLVILSSIALLRPNSLIRPHYLNFFLGDPATKARMKGFVSGVAIPRIILKDFRKFLVVVPPPDIQAAWTHHADSIVATCQALISKNQNLSRTRDLLLPRLLSGQVQLEDVTLP